MIRALRLAATAAAVTTLAACAAPQREIASAPPRAEIAVRLQADVDVLASDAFGGRRPGTPGEVATLNYLVREWQAAGLVSGTNDPANPWFAPVRITLSAPGEGKVALRSGQRRVELGMADGAAFTNGKRALVENAPVIWLEGGVDKVQPTALAGKIAAIPYDPALPDEREALFAKGAAAVLAVADDRATLDAAVERRRAGAYHLDGDRDDTLDAYVAAAALADIMGADRLAKLRRQAAESATRSVELPLTATLDAVSAPGGVQTSNLIGRIPGSRPELGAVLLVAHWDHLGECGGDTDADRLCNGAVDNASGLAVLTELARILGAGPQPVRDIYFLATTAEEWGLLGARAFAQDPPIPLDSIVAAFNFDSVAVAPAGAPVAFVGEGMTQLDPLVKRSIEATGRRQGDRDFARGYVRRQDGWALLQRDVPAVLVSSAFGDPDRLAAFIAARYHQASDEASGIEWGGAIDDLLLHLTMIRELAYSPAPAPR